MKLNADKDNYDLSKTRESHIHNILTEENKEKWITMINEFYWNEDPEYVTSYEVVNINDTFVIVVADADDMTHGYQPEVWVSHDFKEVRDFVEKELI